MADHTIGTGEQGVYQIQLAGGVITTVEVKRWANVGAATANVLVHSGEAPVFARPGTAVAVNDRRSVMIPPLMYASVDLALGRSGVLGLVSAEDAVVSVYR